MPSAMMPAAPVTAVPTAANTCTATGASAAMSHCTSGARIGVPHRQQQRCHRAEARRQLVPERLQVRRSRAHASRSNSCTSTGCSTLAPQRRDDARPRSATPAPAPPESAGRRRPTPARTALPKAPARPCPAAPPRAVTTVESCRPERLPNAGCRRAKAPAHTVCHAAANGAKKFLAGRPRNPPTTPRRLGPARCCQTAGRLGSGPLPSLYRCGGCRPPRCRRWILPPSRPSPRPRPPVCCFAGSRRLCPPPGRTGG